ncbi:GNAT family N-acetyltransferase [Candidatus Dependentiae bacterium]|nr:GNAT family N-acetyltransferase [Candidatus Dependentiae bacterium]
MNILKKNYLLILFGIAAAVLGGFLLYQYTPTAPITSNGIENFQDDRDTQDILRIMKDDWYLLIESEDYSAEHMLKHRAPSQYEPEYFGKMRIKVLRKDDKVVGFVTYYLQKTYQGHILFLVIDKDYRGRGYAQKLIHYALQDLKRMGAAYVRLVTRVENLAAQKLYSEKLGFEEYGRDRGFVNYAKKLD